MLGWVAVVGGERVCQCDRCGLYGGEVHEMYVVVGLKQELD